MKKWSLNSWTKYPAKHLPVYQDKKELNLVLSKIKKYPPLVFAGESRSLKKALAELNAEIQQTHEFILPNNRGIRNIIRINSINKCPHQYPRSIGKPKKQPLGY